MLVARDGFVFVALDFTGQELRIAADDSRDPDYLACYIGDEKRDVHAVTGLKIFNKEYGLDLDYKAYEELVDSSDVAAKSTRTIGKKVNFGSAYGCRGPKLAQMLCIGETEAEAYLEARKAAFPVLINRVKEWHKICGDRGYATTMLGARRHLAGHMYYGSTKDFEKQAADRLAYSFRIQGSAAEMTKLVMGHMYREGVFTDGLVIPSMQIHDELVLQVHESVLEERLPLLVKITCQPYANMIIPMETNPETGKSFGQLKKL